MGYMRLLLLSLVSISFFSCAMTGQRQPSQSVSEEMSEKEACSDDSMMGMKLCQAYHLDVREKAALKQRHELYSKMLDLGQDQTGGINDRSFISDLQHLDTEQFTNFRDSICSVESLDSYGGTMESLIYLSCATSYTDTHTAILSWAHRLALGVDVMSPKEKKKFGGATVASADKSYAALRSAVAKKVAALKISKDDPKLEEWDRDMQRASYERLIAASGNFNTYRSSLCTTLTRFSERKERKDRIQAVCLARAQDAYEKSLTDGGVHP